jgi:acyl-CoA thioester hydrolase
MSDERFGVHVDVRVRFAETDAQGVVYHANFLVYCEVARTEYFRALYGELTADERRHGRDYDTTIVHAACDYRAPARFDDSLRIWCRVAELGRSSLTFAYRVARITDEQLICEARTVQVAISRATRKSTPLPSEFVSRVRAFEDSLSAGSRSA